MDIIISYLHSGFTQIFSFVVLLGVLIFVHELGHFLVARWCGVKVEVFSLGFGKKIFQYQKNDTNYCISMIPLGGYVKMFGEQPGEEIPESDKKVSFSHKKVGQRAAIVLAGPLMNLFFAFFIFVVISIIGETTKAPYIGEVITSSYAEKMGFRSGDKILRVNNTNIQSWDQFQEELDKNIDQKISVEVMHEGEKTSSMIELEIKSKKNPNILSTKKQLGDIQGITLFSYAPVVTVLATSRLYQLGMRTGDRITEINNIPVNNFRDLEKVLLEVTKTQDSVSFQSGTQKGIQSNSKDRSEKIDFKIVREDLDSKKSEILIFSLEIENTPAMKELNALSLEKLGLDSPQLYIDKVVPDTPAAKSGLQKGDKIVSINGEKLRSWEDILNSIKNYSEEKGPLVLDIQRNGELQKISVVPQMTSQMSPSGMEDKRFTIGISPYLMYSNPETVVVSQKGFQSILSRAVERTWEVSVMTVMSFVKLIQNQISPKNIGGIFSIAQAANETFKIGISAFLHMMALISINLFILNLLPIPVLDGGHLFFYFIEALKGSPLSLSKMELAQKVGMVLLFSLMIFALVNDFRRILGLM